jgi:hypothetical protein
MSVTRAPTPAIHLAAEANDLERLKQELASGVSPELLTPENGRRFGPGATPLAIEKQHRDIFVKILAPKLEDRIPKDVVPLIVTYWVHLGFWVHTRTSAHAH